MKINSINSQQCPSFRNLIVGESVQKVLKSNHSSNAFLYEFHKIESAAKMLGIDSKDNVDVILNHAPGEGFFGIISSKKYGIPNSLFYRCNVSCEHHDIMRFNNWVTEWDYEYAENTSDIHKLNTQG